VNSQENEESVYQRKKQRRDSETTTTYYQLGGGGRDFVQSSGTSWQASPKGFTGRVRRVGWMG
jgi:hypothetical protein